MDPTQIVAFAKAAPEVVKEAYGDVASPGLKQGGKLGEDIVKAARLILFPVQFAAAIQDRLDEYINKAIRQVPAARLIAPTESIILPVAEKLRFQEVTNPVTNLYINLLSRAMDGERVGEAHPAFINVIEQLAPDEVLLLREIAGKDYTLIMAKAEQWYTPTIEEIHEKIEKPNIPEALIKRSYSIVFKYHSLNQPELFPVFLEHVSHLGLIKVTNDPINRGEYKGFYRYSRDQMNISFIQLSNFGRLFYNACVADLPG